MITLNSLSLRSFMCVDSADLNFSDNYITVFYGENGSGKSTIFEAVALCWTERRRGDSYKDFIMHGADSAEIHLTASVRNEPIQFDIEIRDKKGSTPFQRKITYKGAEYVNSECTALLNSFDIDYLQHIMFSMQGESNITELRPAERTKLLKKIFNFEFEAQLNQIDKLVEQEEQNMLVLKTRADIMSHLKFDYDEEEKPLELVELKRIETRIKEIDATLKTQEQNQLLQSESAQRLAGLQAQGAAVKSRKHTIDTDISNLEGSRARLLGDKQRHNQSILTLPDPIRLEAEIAEKTTAIESLSRLVEQNKKYIEEKVAALNTRHSSMLELKNHIEAHKAGKCPKCGQATQPDAVPTLEQSLEKISKEYEDLTAQRSTLEIDERTAEKTIAKYQIEIPNLRDRIATAASTKIQFESIIKTLEESVQQTDVTIQMRKNTLVEVEKQIEDLEQQIDEIAPKMLRLIPAAPLQEEKNKLSAQIQEHQAVLSRNVVIKRKNLELEKKEKDNKKALSDLNKQQNDILLSINNYKEAKRILEVDLPNYIIIKACSKLENHINQFIGKIKPGMVVRLFQARSGVEFFYSPKGGVEELDDWTSTKMASGFEKELLSAAWRVALARAYNLYALMLDEVDSAANTFSSEKMFREIANLTGFEQLFIISHKPEVVDILLQENDKVTAYYVSDGTFARQEY